MNFRQPHWKKLVRGAIINTRCLASLYQIGKSQRRFNESLVFFLVIILLIKIDIMKFIGKLDNPSGEMGITHKGKPEG